MSTADLVELIKAVGSAAGVIIGAVTVGYARVSAKRAKEASQQTATTVRVDGELRTKSSAETAEEALAKTAQLQHNVDTLIGRLAYLEADAGRPGPGIRRRPTPKEIHEAQ